MDNSNVDVENKMGRVEQVNTELQLLIAKCKENDFITENFKNHSMSTIHNVNKKVLDVRVDADMSAGYIEKIISSIKKMNDTLVTNTTHE